MIGILGGSFDPVHLGHLRPALELYQDLKLSEVRFIPSGLPPHRATPTASNEQRLAMIKAAIAGHDGFTLDERELRRTGPSYTIDTLISLRTELAETPICLIVGQDAFAKLDTWRRWRELITFAHIVIARRPGQEVVLAQDLAALLAERRIEDPRKLAQQAAGYILNWPVTQLDISSSQIRDGVARGKSIRYLVPDAVEKIISSQGLYLNNDQRGQEELNAKK